MKLPQLPPSPKEWNCELIYELVKYVAIESESFDFKLEPHKLHEDICAMANTANGYIVLGIDEVKKNGKIDEFKPVGFQEGKQDDMGTKIGNYIVEVEPHPIVEIEPISDKSKGIFFSVIKVVGKLSEKPYFLKKTDECFVRIHNSSRRIGRTAILNLFSYSYEKRKNIEVLRSATFYLKEELNETLKYLESINTKYPTNAPPLDLNYIRNSVLLTNSFLAENDLVAKKTGEGFSFVFHTIELLNSYIHKFNSTINVSLRTQMREMMVTGNYIYRDKYNQVIKFLDKVIVSCDEFLKKG